MDISQCDSCAKAMDMVEVGWRAFVGLSWRTLRYYRRQWFQVMLVIVASVLAGVVIGLVYGKLGLNQEDVQNRFGSIGFVCIFIGIQSIASIESFISTRDVYIDERNGQLYGPIAYISARVLPDLLLTRILPSFLFGLIVFEMLGFQNDTQGEYLITIVLLSCVSSMFVLMISSMSSNSYIAGMISIFSNLVFLLFGGMFIQNSERMPWFVDWIKWLSYYRHAYEIMFVNEMEGLDFEIDDATVTIEGSEIETDGLDVSLSGEYFIELFGFKSDRLPLDYSLLIAFLFIYFAFAIAALQFLHRSKR